MIYKTEMITVDGVIGFTAAAIASALADMANVGRDGTIKRVVCTVEAGSIRIKMDGSNPTSVIGHLLEVGDAFIVHASDVNNFKAIKVAAIAKIAVSYEV